MARTLLDMSKAQFKRAATISNVGNDAKVRKVLAALRYLVDVTPVDTSEALSNWQLGIGEPPVAKRRAFYPGEHGSTRDQSASTAYLFGVEQLRDIKPGTPVYLSNLAPYIRRLNEGYSSQHPGGFVESAQSIIRNTP